ncbi:MAG: hypothetical protein ACRDRN_11440 [Sciscionella sp.]
MSAPRRSAPTSGKLTFAIADAETGKAVGAIGVFLQKLTTGRATAGYSVPALHRGRGSHTTMTTAWQMRTRGDCTWA